MNPSPNRRAFLDMIAFSEIGPALLALSDNGYNVLVGATPAHPLLFKGYDKHPHILNHKLNSTAAGRYQVILRTWCEVRVILKYTDFSPATQDAIALELIRERNAMDDIDAGHIEVAIGKCANIWASFPGNKYGQPTHTIADLLAAFVKAGGVLSQA